MKKIAMFMAAAAIAVSANAQKTVTTGNKALDNTYVGINVGAQTNLSEAGDKDAFGLFAPDFGIRLGKNFNPVFGLAIEGSVYFDAYKRDGGYGNKTFVKAIDANLLGTVNLMNLFAGYKGTPRSFEIYALGGFGWSHGYGDLGLYGVGKVYGENGYNDALNSKLALDFAYNFGADKQWQGYIEPSITYRTMNGSNALKYNINDADFGLKVGVNYKFMTSNGTHNFAIEQLRDQAEIDGLNAKINALRSDVDAAKASAAAKDAKIAELQKALTDCQNKPVEKVVEKKTANLAPTVIFSQGKSVVEKSQLANCEMIAKYMKNNPDAKVKISGYASPEGSAELNQKLSEKRAEAVKNVLVKNYKISADRLETEGLGATDKLFDQVEFNRVAVFNDTTK